MMTGEQLRAWRAAHNLTQSDLAERLEVSQALVARWESDQRSPGDLLAVEIARLERRGLERRAPGAHDPPGPGVHEPPAGYARYPVAEWGPFRYVLFTQPMLHEGVQLLVVADVTDTADLYTEPGRTSDTAHGRLEEGQVGLLRSRAGTPIRAPLLDLPVRVGPAALQDGHAPQQTMAGEASQ